MTDGQTHGRRTDFGTKLINPFFLKKKSGIIKQEIPLKKIYDEVTEEIFDMSNMRIFKEIEKKTILYVFGQLSSVKRLANGTYAIPNYL